MKYGSSYWNQELTAFFESKRERIQYANDSERAFSTPNAGKNRYNLYPTHIKLMNELVFSSAPKITVSRSNKDADDDVSRVAGLILERGLRQSQCARGYDFVDVFKRAIQDWLVAGLGVVRVDILQDGVVQPHTKKGQEEQTEELSADDYGLDTIDEPIIGTVVPSYVSWRDFSWSYARCWKEVWWCGFRHYFTKEDAKKAFPPATVEKMTFDRFIGQTDMQNMHNNATVSEIAGEKSQLKYAEVFEIWCKETKKVYWISKGCDKVLQEYQPRVMMPDFFPCPPPMVNNQSSDELSFYPDYIDTKNLYDQVNTYQIRIEDVLNQVRVLGVYDQTWGSSIANLLNDSTRTSKLIPVENTGQLIKGTNGIADAISWFPIEQFMEVLERLELSQERVIQKIYMMTGVTDMLQGAMSQQGQQPQSATETAQQGRVTPIRLQTRKSVVEDFFNNFFNLQAGFMCRYYTPLKFIKVGLLNQLQEPVKELIPQAIRQLHTLGLEGLKVEVHADSMSYSDKMLLKEERLEFLNKFGFVMQSLQHTPPDLLPVLIEVTKWALATFKGAKEIEGVTDEAMEQLMASVEQQRQQQAEMPPENPNQQHENKMAEMKLKHELEMMREQARFEHEKELELLRSSTALDKIDAEQEKSVAVEAVQAQADVEVQTHKTDEEIRKEVAKADIMMNKASTKGEKTDGDTE